jgi:hypothetical protein
VVARTTAVLSGRSDGPDPREWAEAESDTEALGVISRVCARDYIREPVATADRAHRPEPPPVTTRSSQPTGPADDCHPATVRCKPRGTKLMT